MPGWPGKVINVPNVLHEFFGPRITTLELFLIIVPGTLLTALLVWKDAAYFREIGLLRSLIMTVLILDIFYGVIANLTSSTNDYYAVSPVRRHLFIAIHVQPIIFYWLLGDYFSVCFFAWAYTVSAAAIVNLCIRHHAQRAIAGTALSIGLTLLLVWSEGLPVFLLIALVMFMIKVIYSFPVHHTGRRT
jgi:hypothetical protein